MADLTDGVRKHDTRVNNWRSEIPHDNPDVARLTAVTMALAAELAVVRERLDTVERVAEGAGVFRQDDIERFIPDNAAVAARDGLRRRLLRNIFRAFKMDAERMARSVKTGQSGDGGAG